jgi:cytochrome c553
MQHPFFPARPLRHAAITISWAIAVALLSPPATVAAEGAPATPQAAREDATARIEAGRRIYEKGILPSGAPVRALRDGKVPVSGAGAACVLCHRRSGMGVAEGLNFVPPVTAPALFQPYRPVGHQPRTAPGVKYTDFPSRTRPPYDSASLARALRDGESPGGHRFQFMMPRYELADADMAALEAYLRTLSAVPSPGVEGRTSHFATVIAPGVDPARRKAMLDVLEACFAERFPIGHVDPRSGGMPSLRLEWKLHVWDMTGSPDTWRAQLDAWFEQNPVFALVSGLGGETWAPVHAFCEDKRLPCLFPNVDAPGATVEGDYAFYFSGGVHLEARALAQWLVERRAELGLARVVQVSRPQTAGAEGAAALRAALAGAGLDIEDRSAGEDWEAVVSGLGDKDALVLWLRDRELAQLVRRVPKPPAGLVVASGTLGGADRPPLPVEWRKRARIVYPFDPPARWAKRMAFNLQPFLSRHQISKVDLRLQGNTLTACNFLATGFSVMQGRGFSDYLVEAIENGGDGNSAAPSAFPRFTLGPSQRFGAKGAYVVRFEPPKWGRIARDGDWIVP